MPSKQLRKQARLNSAKVAGSKTSAGGPKSGLVLTNESQLQFDDLRQTYVEEFQPQGGVEKDLVDQMVAAQWRLRRIWRMQTATLDLKMGQQEEWIAKTFDRINETERTTIAFKSMANDGKALELLLRYETACVRMHKGAMNSLFKLRKEKLRNDPEPGTEPRASASDTANYETTPIAAPVAEGQLRLITLPGCTEHSPLLGDKIDCNERNVNKICQSPPDLLSPL